MVTDVEGVDDRGMKRGHHDVEMDAEGEGTRGESGSTNEGEIASTTTQMKTVRLAGDARVLQELMLLKGKLQMLKKCCTDVREDVRRLHRTIPDTSRWVLRATGTRLRHEAKTRRILEKRLAKLASLLK